MTTHLSASLSKFVNGHRPRKIILDMETVVKIAKMLDRPRYNPEWYVSGNELHQVWTSIDSSDGRSYTSDWARIEIPITIGWRAEIGKKMITYCPQLPEQHIQVDYKWKKGDAMSGYIIAVATRMMPKEFRIRQIKNPPEEMICLKIGGDEYACYLSERYSYLTPVIVKDFKAGFVTR